MKVESESSDIVSLDHNMFCFLNLVFPKPNCKNGCSDKDNYNSVFTGQIVKPRLGWLLTGEKSRFDQGKPSCFLEKLSFWKD